MSDTLNDTAITDTAKQGLGDQGYVAGARKSLGEAYETSSDVLGAVYETALEAIKERPVAAAAIGVGVAATVAGAAYGATKLKKAKSGETNEG